MSKILKCFVKVLPYASIVATIASAVVAIITSAKTQAYYKRMENAQKKYYDDLEKNMEKNFTQIGAGYAFAQEGLKSGKLKI